ncbi:MAG TPA: trypsin-like serine protease [Terriglobales bacterium]|nr:trypsin-like serine protease [Terriglobales bacterium]
MKRVLAAVMALAVTLTLAMPAAAITGNFVEDFEHTYVGLVAFYDENGEFISRCSGALLSPTIFLTAGHCTADAASARIWFHQDVGSQFDPVTEAPDPRTGYPDTCIQGDPLCVTSTELYNRGFNDFAGFPEIQDVGIVVLDEPITFTTEFAVLAEPGSLDYLATNARRGPPPPVTFTGYGVSDIRPATLSLRERLMATGFIINVRSANTAGFNVQVSTNVGQGRGGTCFGDSGGPILWGDTNIVIAVNSFVINGNCAGTGFGYRVDTQAVYDWIAQVTGVRLPTASIS